MIKRREGTKIEKLEKRWDADLAWLNHGWHEVWKRIKRFIRHEMEGMMYGKRPKDPIDRYEHAFWWWLKLFIIIFAIKGLGII